MKICTYCGRRSTDDAIVCSFCEKDNLVKIENPEYQPPQMAIGKHLSKTKKAIVIIFSILFICMIPPLVVIALFPELTSIVFQPSKTTGNTTSMNTTRTTETTVPTTDHVSLTSLIKINHIGVSEPNSADGVDWRVSFDNLSSKTIKYITFSAQAFNPVGDAVSDDITGRSIRRCELTGPIEAKRLRAGATWECVWYNKTISTSRLTSIEIEYMDGSSLYISQEDLQKLGYKIDNFDRD